MYIFKISVKPAPELDKKGNLAYLIINLTSYPDEKIINLSTIVLENLNQLDWFFENEKNIREDILPIRSDIQFSIAEAINQYYDNLNPDVIDDDQIEEIYNYRCAHGIRFAFRGQDLPDIYIGINNSIYEISCAENGFVFNYKIDIDSLFNQIQYVQKEYLNLAHRTD